jgi:hypothetical protein
MGKILNGILGGVSGKVAGVVGANWKGISYLRAYAVPANPQTPAQQAQRSKLAFLVKLGKLMKISVIQSFWDPFVTSMSGFNDFISKNLKRISSAEDYDNVQVAHGDLQLDTEGTLLYDAASTTQHFSANPKTDGNGEATDKTVVVAYSEETDYIYTHEFDQRGVDDDVSFMPKGLDYTKIHCWYFNYRGTGSDMLVSNSGVATIEIP